MRRAKGKPVCVAEALYRAASRGTGDFDALDDDAQLFFKQMGSIVAKRYRIGATNLKIIGRMGDFAVGTVLASIAVLAWVHWPWAIMFALGVLNGAAVMSIAAYISNAQPFTMDDLP